ncbi:hypothetical protein [Pseudomonas kilonensis]|uniref:Uncharacterized protein n=1 Tax=Pseudomonas kilonensis TaxID=132476 RepID=A0ABY0ZA75_9PSED|nr:hypothetical protein [Pseudomonas kilonensis]SEE47129.1 hypothetical protein SAMN04490188_3993 [Pseudomonas kilonensis]
MSDEYSLSDVLERMYQSTFVDSHRLGDSSMMIELSDFDERANVLRFVTDEVSECEFIETYWLAGPDSDDVSRPKDPNPDTAQPLRTCKRIYPSVQPPRPPRHLSTFIVLKIFITAKVSYGLFMRASALHVAASPLD